MFKHPISVSRLSLLAACGLGVVLSVSTGQAADFTRNNGYNNANNYKSNYNSTTSSGYGSGIGKAGPNRISGAAGGLQGGYNWQSDRFVYGLEADYTASDLLSRSVADSYRQNWTVSGRGRAGYAFASNLLGYGTAGLAGSGTEYKSTNGKHNTTSYGWVAGLGAELMVDPRFTIRGELLHYEFGHETYPGSTGQVNLGNSTNVLRLGGNYKF
ncbi:MAG: porin family protein [Methylococcaceae bacterium]|nr:porin family protein [Methylococcaceae bacterium]